MGIEDVIMPIEGVTLVKEGVTMIEDVTEITDVMTGHPLIGLIEKNR